MKSTGTKSHNSSDKSTGKDFLQSVRAAFPFRASDLKNLGRRDSLRIGKIAVYDHRPAQRNRKQHAETASACRNKKRLPKFKAMPVTDHKHTRNDEYDGRESARRRCLRLYHVVLEDI